MRVATRADRQARSQQTAAAEAAAAPLFLTTANNICSLSRSHKQETFSPVTSVA